MESDKTIKIAAAQYPVDRLQTIQDWRSKIEIWMANAIQESASYILFPEYALLELTALLNEEDCNDLKKQAHHLRDLIPVALDFFSKQAVLNKVYIIGPSAPVIQSGKTVNRCFVFSPNGKIEFQDKLFMTRFEEEDWGIESPESLEIKVFQTPHLKFSISTCFDAEFAMPAIAAALHGAQAIFIPSCTETIKGVNRVHIGAKARALENQLFTIVSQLIGEAKWSPAIDSNTGYAAIYTTPDVGQPDDGVLAQGNLNTSCWVTGSIRPNSLERVRKNAAVLNHKKHQDFFKDQKAYFKCKTVEL